MIEVLSFLASYGTIGGGGAFGTVLAQWEQAGVFSYVLPFLLIFAIVFTILMNVHIFKSNKGVNVIIALAVALMSLQFDFVTVFFAELFPRFGVALAIILILLIFGGLFIDKENKAFKWILIILVFVVISVVILKSLGAVQGYMGYAGTGAVGYFLRNNWPNLLIGAIIVGAIIAVIAQGGNRKELADVGVPALGLGKK